MSGLSKKDVRRLIKALEAQGVSVEELTVGVRFRLPNGEVLVVHWTASDSKSLLAQRSIVKRAGLLWPFDDRAAIRAAQKKVRKQS